MISLFRAIVVLIFIAPVSLARAEKLVLVAGGGTNEEDSTPAKEARLNEPFAVDFDARGNMYIVELDGGRVLVVNREGILRRVAGDQEKGAANGQAAKARFNGMHHLLVNPEGMLLIADTWNQQIRKIDPYRQWVMPLAGSGEKGFAGDGGPAEEAKFGGIYCLALSPKKDRLFAMDLDNRRVRVIDLESRLVTTFAGNGEKGVPADGAPAKDAPLVDPRAVTVDSTGLVYILERSGHALRVVDHDGKIRTVAGTGKAGFCDDGGPALECAMNGPKHLSVDADDNVFIADTENHVILKFLPREGKIVRVAGTGRPGSAGLEGPPKLAQLNRPHGAQVGPKGELFISDSSNGRIVKIEP